MEDNTNKPVTGKIPNPPTFDYSDKNLNKKSLYAKGHKDLFARLYK